MTHQPHEHQQQQEPAQASSKATWQAQAREQLGVYGYGLADKDEAGHFRITRNGKTLGVGVRFAAKRFRTFVVSSGDLLWTGPDLGNFCAAFWYAVRVKTTP